MQSFRRGAIGAAVAAVVSSALPSAAHAGTLTSSGFEPGQTWAGSAYVTAAAWPSSFNGSYALHVRNSKEFKKYPTSGTFSQKAVAVRMHFRVESDALRHDPDHDDSPIDVITLLGVQPFNTAGTRPKVGIRRNDDMLCLRIEDYAKFTMLKEVVIVPGRWHVLELAVDQNTSKMIVALDGVEVYHDDAASVDAGQPFTLVDFGIIQCQVNGHSLWIDDVLIQDKATLVGPEIDATATATPGVGAAPLTVAFDSTSSDSSATIEWDFDGDGTFDATGATKSKTYNSIGDYPAVVRVTAGSSRGVAYPPVVHAFDPKAPSVTLTKEAGGNAADPYPRTIDCRAVATPSSGARIKKVEWDWQGGDVFGWNARTSWDTGSALTTFLPHRFQLVADTPTVRVRVTDSSGRAGYGELPLTLPPDNPKPTIDPRDSRAGLYVTYHWKEMFLDRGNQLPGWVKGFDVSGYLHWADIETSSGVFDFGPLDGSNPTSYNGRIHDIIGAGGYVILHHQAYFPSWIFNQVGKSKQKNSLGEYYPQFWDPRYLALYRRFILASAANVKALIQKYPSWADKFVLSRGQCFATDGELLFTGQFPVVAYKGKSYQMNLTAANFTPPASGAYNVDFTPELATAFVAFERGTYAEAFDPLGIPSVFKPRSGGYYAGFDSGRADDEHWRATCNRGEGFFSSAGMPETGEEHFMAPYTSTGITLGFVEQTNEFPKDGAQWNYWSMLSQLQLGIEYPSVYGDIGYYLEYQPEYWSEPVYAFVNRHVGFEPYPKTAPAAWIAMKPPTAPPNSTYTTGDYGAFLVANPADGWIDEADVGSVHYVYKGPTGLGHPGTLDETMKWSRKIPAFAKLGFEVADRFASAHTDDWDLDVTFFDSYPGKFDVTIEDPSNTKTYTVNMGGTNKWVTKTVQIRDIGTWFYNKTIVGRDFTIKADAQATSFHMLVLKPRDDIP
jgi:hypothetical protein